MLVLLSKSCLTTQRHSYEYNKSLGIIKTNSHVIWNFTTYLTPKYSHILELCNLGTTLSNGLWSYPSKLFVLVTFIKVLIGCFSANQKCRWIDIKEIINRQMIYSFMLNRTEFAQLWIENNFSLQNRGYSESLHLYQGLGAFFFKQRSAHLSLCRWYFIRITIITDHLTQVPGRPPLYTWPWFITALGKISVNLPRFSEVIGPLN